jgi:hypothetical protein
MFRNFCSFFVFFGIGATSFAGPLGFSFTQVGENQVPLSANGQGSILLRNDQYVQVYGIWNVNTQSYRALNGFRRPSENVGDFLLEKLSGNGDVYALRKEVSGIGTSITTNLVKWNKNGIFSTVQPNVSLQRLVDVNAQGELIAFDSSKIGIFKVSTDGSVSQVVNDYFSVRFGRNRSILVRGTVYQQDSSSYNTQFDRDVGGESYGSGLQAQFDDGTFIAYGYSNTNSEFNQRWRRMVTDGVIGTTYDFNDSNNFGSGTKLEVMKAGGFSIAQSYRFNRTNGSITTQYLGGGFMGFDYIFNGQRYNMTQGDLLSGSTLGSFEFTNDPLSSDTTDNPFLLGVRFDAATGRKVGVVGTYSSVPEPITATVVGLGILCFSRGRKKISLTQRP